MALDIGAALRDGLGRTFKRNGLILMGAFLLLGLVSTVASQSLARSFSGAFDARSAAPGAAFGPAFGAGFAQEGPLALPIPLPAVLVLVAAMALLAEAVRIVAVRTLVSDRTDTVPGEAITHNIVFATLNGFVGGIVVGVLIVIGLVLLVLPGVFLALSFFFVRQEIAVEDRNFVDAMADSWGLTKGNRLALLVLAIVIAVIELVAAAPAIATVALGPLTGTVVTSVVGAVTTTFAVAVTARAYDQLRTERQERLGELDDGEFVFPGDEPA